jgi:predicted DNA-binding transcriptional regulator AlpA
MPRVPPNQVSPFPDSRPSSRRHDPEPRQSDRGIGGLPRGPQPRVLRTPDAALYVGLTASTLEKMRLTGVGPRFVRLGTRAVGYAMGDLDAFIDQGRRSSTSDLGQSATSNAEAPKNLTASATERPRARSRPAKALNLRGATP